jgi:hypothetical protein
MVRGHDRLADLEGGSADLVDGLRRLVSSKDAVLYLRGPYGAGKQRIAQALGANRGMGVLVIDMARVLAQSELAFGDAVTLLLREARLQRAAPYWAGFDALLAEPHRALLGDFQHVLASSSQAATCRSLPCPDSAATATLLTWSQSARLSSRSQAPIGRVLSSARRACAMVW